MGAVSVITSGKGGVGKSTVTVGISSALSVRGRRVLLIDADAGLPCLDKMVGIRTAMPYTVSDVIDGVCAPAQAIYRSLQYPNVWLLTAPHNEEEMPEPEEMQLLLQMLRKYFDHVLIDCPAGIGRGFRMAVAAADRAIVVSTADDVCVRSAAKTVKLLQKEGISQRELVLNRFSPEIYPQLSNRDLDHVIDTVGAKLLGIIPEDSTFAVPLLCGARAEMHTAGQMAMSRIVSRMENERVPLPEIYR